MSVLPLLVIVSIGLGLIGLAAFVWALRNNQFEDLDGDAERIFFDEEGPKAGIPGAGSSPRGESGDPGGGQGRPSSAER